MSAEKMGVFGQKKEIKEKCPKHLTFLVVHVSPIIKWCRRIYLRCKHVKYDFFFFFTSDTFQKLQFGAT